MDTPIEYNWCEEEILIETIKEDWSNLNYIIEPILQFCKKIGLDKETLIKIIKRAYNFGISKTVNDLILELNIEKSAAEINLNNYFEEEVAKELLNCNFDEMFLELSDLQETDKER